MIKEQIDTIHIGGRDIPYIHRDVSWLSFNYRVLQEAKDPLVPLLERVKFLAIYSSNLTEFFKVRMSNHRNLLRSNQDGGYFEPEEIVTKIRQELKVQQEEFSRIRDEEILPALEANHIRILRRQKLNPQQLQYIESYFNVHLLPFVQPILLVGSKIRPFLKNDALYLAVWMKDKDIEHPNLHTCAIVSIPSDQFPRFLQLPSEGDWRDLIMLDDIIRHNIAFMFPGYDIIDTFSIKLTRDAELYIDDEKSGDLVNKIKESLARREVGLASRFVYDRAMPKPLLNFLVHSFRLEQYDLLPEGRYHNNFDFFQFPNFGLTAHLNEPLPPLPYHPLESTPRFFEAIKERDHLIHVPYHSYESVVRFFEQASLDPQVTHIRIIQYRVASESRIMEALMNAVNLGKKVSAFIEVKARFDEEANLRWGEKLKRAGVEVNYSFPELKVHSKVALVKRMENGKEQVYTYLSTGNFHEKTARLYSDFGFFTADERITSEVLRVFGYLDTKTNGLQFQHLLVGQFNLRTSLDKLIDNEIEAVKAGKKGAITLKVNSLQYRYIIKKLYEASNQGVKIKLIVRGICSLIPQLPNWSENIEAISIIDRYLEHARIFIFHNHGDEKIYLSSADLMGRNLKHRIETAFPIYDPALKKEILDFVQLQLSDNIKSRVIDKSNANAYAHDRSTVQKPIRSQIATYEHIKSQNKVWR